MTTQAITDPRPIDVTSWIGGYPFRDVPHPDPEILVRVLDREPRRASSAFFSSHFFTNSPMILEAPALVMSAGS